jgi:hypothetical protein
MVENKCATDGGNKRVEPFVVANHLTQPASEPGEFELSRVARYLLVDKSTCVGK